jgi:hypothetical protein
MMQIEVVRTDFPIRYTDAANEQNHDDCDARKRERHRSSLPRRITPLLRAHMGEYLGLKCPGCSE